MPWGPSIATRTPIFQVHVLNKYQVKLAIQIYLLIPVRSKQRRIRHGRNDVC
jgi:hypothetical protein